MLSTAESAGSVTHSPKASDPIAIQRKGGQISPQSASRARTAFRKMQTPNSEMPPIAPHANIRQNMPRPNMEQSLPKLSDPNAWPTPEVTRFMSPKAKVTTASASSSTHAIHTTISHGMIISSTKPIEGALGGMVGMMRQMSLDSVQTQEGAETIAVDIVSVSSSHDLQSLTDSDNDSSEAYPEGGLTRCSTPSQEGRETVITESSSLPDNISLSLLTQEPRSVDSLDNENGGSEPSSMERRLEQRQKQLDFGKNTPGYDRYSRLVPKNKRKRGDPQTPDKYGSYSKRAWDGLIRVWRRKLHAWDPPGLPISASHLAKLERQAEQARNAAAMAEEHNRIHGYEPGEIPQSSYSSMSSSGGLSFHRRIPFANMSSVPATQPIPVITLVNPIPPHPASARELTAMTEHLKAIVIRPVEEVEVPLENVTVEDIKLETRSPGTETSELPPLPVEQSSENIATNEPELSENCVEQPENLAFVADHSKPPCALVTTLETRASAIARQPSPPIKSPASIRSFNWVEDADAEVDWEVEEIEVHAHHSESDLEEGEIRE